MGEVALPQLEKILLDGKVNQMIEAIDAIGYIAFYSKNIRSLPVLWKVWESNHLEKIIAWKIVRAFESFPTKEVKMFLDQIICGNYENRIKLEAQRSIQQINQILE